MVEWKKLSDVSKRNKGIPITAGQMSELATPSGNVRVFAAGQTIADINEEDLPTNCVHKEPSVIVKSRGYIDFEFYEKPFTHKNEMWSYSFKEKETGKYLYYYLSTKTDFFRKKAKANSVKLPQLCVADTDNYLIPIVSLSEQKRIVDILDTFTSSIENLKEQIAQRRKQYDYYRDQLLDLEGKEGVEAKKLGDVCKYQNGFAFKSNLFKEYGKPIIRITNITSNIVDMNDCKYFDLADYSSMNLSQFLVNSGDILLAMSGATTGKVGVYKDNIPAYMNQRVGKFLPEKQVLKNRYLYHFLLSKTYDLYIMAGGGAQPNLSSNKLMEELLIPIPSLFNQQRIVDVLDKFEASIQNLEAQLSLREKQYEYYRNKLLTFE